jgi:hypothetical protein
LPTVPINVPPWKNSTRVMKPSGSTASAASWRLTPAAKGPQAPGALVSGAVIATSGAWFTISTGGGGGAAETVMFTAADVALSPALLVALAVSEYVPAATFDQTNLYGEVVADPISVVPPR